MLTFFHPFPQGGYGRPVRSWSKLLSAIGKCPAPSPLSAKITNSPLSRKDIFGTSIDFATAPLADLASVGAKREQACQRLVDLAWNVAGRAGLFWHQTSSIGLLEGRKTPKDIASVIGVLVGWSQYLMCECRPFLQVFFNGSDVAVLAFVSWIYSDRVELGEESMVSQERAFALRRRRTARRRCRHLEDHAWARHHGTGLSPSNTSSLRTCDLGSRLDHFLKTPRLIPRPQPPPTRLSPHCP